MDHLTSTLPEVYEVIPKWFIHTFKTQKVVHHGSFWTEGWQQSLCWYWKSWENTEGLWQQCQCPLLRALIPHNHFPISVSSVIIFAIFSSLPVSPPSVSPHPSLSNPSCKSSLALEVRVSSLEFQCLRNHPLKFRHTRTSLQCQKDLTSFKKHQSHCIEQALRSRLGNTKQYTYLTKNVRIIYLPLHAFRRHVKILITILWTPFYKSEGKNHSRTVLRDMQFFCKRWQS